jgi:hypothetical protein
MNLSLSSPLSLLIQIFEVLKIYASAKAYQRMVSEMEKDVSLRKEIELLGSNLSLVKG